MLALGVLLTLVWIGTLIWIVFYLLVTTSQRPSGSSKAETCVEDDVRTQKSQRSTMCAVAHWPMAKALPSDDPAVWPDLGALRVTIRPLCCKRNRRSVRPVEIVGLDRYPDEVVVAE